MYAAPVQPGYAQPQYAQPTAVAPRPAAVYGQPTAAAYGQPAAAAYGQPATAGAVYAQVRVDEMGAMFMSVMLLGVMLLGAMLLGVMLSLYHVFEQICARASLHYGKDIADMNVWDH